MIRSNFKMLVIPWIAILIGVPFEAHSQESEDTPSAEEAPEPVPSSDETSGQDARGDDVEAKLQEVPAPVETEVPKETETTESGEGTTAAPAKEAVTATPPPPASPEPAAFPESPRVEEDDAEEKEEIPKTSGEIATWSLVGIASLGVITGGIFGFTALDEKHRNEDNPNDAFKDRRKSRALAAYISFSMAGAAAIAALIVGLTTDWEPESAPVALGTDGTSIQITF
ncbi:MAG: hypothetical protein GY854_31555 [Deltaproteobacteria bacterium]|nr:hypothetical protein [Deltaproteobacteria bacterium]